MEQAEQTALASEAGAMIIVDDNDHDKIVEIKFEPEELAAYTAAVETRTRRQCANEADDMPDHCTAYEASEKIRSLK